MRGEKRRVELTSIVSVRMVMLGLLKEILVPSSGVFSSKLSSLSRGEGIGLGGEGGRVETGRVVAGVRRV